MARRGRVLLAAAVIPLVALAAACGGNNDNSPSTSGSDPVKIAMVVGVSGGQAPSAAMWIAGVNQAAKEINASGGILGHQVETSIIDTRSDPATSIASMRKALEDKPYAVLGTILSSATLVNMSVLAAAGVPQITGSVSPKISETAPTSLFRTEPNSNLEAQMFANWMTNQAHAQKVAFVYGNDEFGTSGEKSFATLVKSAGAEVVGELSTQVGQTSFAADVARLQQLNPDTVFMYMHETETGRFLQQAANAGLQAKMRFLGASSALAQTTVQLAGPAAEGVQGFVPYSASAPGMADLAKAYEDSHNGVAPDHNYFKGYVALWMIAYATQDNGKLDQKALVETLHSKTFCLDQYPHLLQSTHWDEHGDIDRATYVVKITDGKQQVVDTIKPLHPDSFTACKS